MVSKPRVLFFIHFNSYFANLFKIARLLKEEGTYDPIISFATDYPNRGLDLKECAKHSITVFDSKGDLLIDTQFVPVDKTKKTARKAFLPERIQKFLRDFKQVFLRFRFWKRRLRELENFFQKEKISLLVLGGDIAGTDTAAVIKAGHRNHIKSVGFVNWLGKYEAALIYRSNPDYHVHSFFNKLAAKLYPRWVHYHDGQEYLKLPGPEILVLELLKLAPVNPWVLHSGELDAIGVEGNVMREAAIAMELNPQRIHATGSMQNDEMFEIKNHKQNYVRKLYRDLGIQNDKPILLTALPPDFLYEVSGNHMCPDCDFRVYSDLVKFWIGSLGKVTTHQVIVSLHPSVDPEKFRYIEGFGVKIADKRIPELIPLADIFIACVSATINWAIACGVPVINYDVYRYKYSDYVNAPGVLTIEEQSEFLELVHQMTANSKFYQKMKKTQEDDAPRWAVLDGLTKERISAIIHSLILTKDMTRKRV